MRRSFGALLWDMQKAGRRIREYTAGMSLEDYRQNTLVKSAVERNFMILGEAMVNAGKYFPTESEELGERRGVIGFRNQLVHCYEQIDDEKVWGIIHLYLPELVTKLDQLIPPLLAESPHTNS